MNKELTLQGHDTIDWVAYVAHAHCTSHKASGVWSYDGFENAQVKVDKKFLTKEME